MSDPKSLGIIHPAWRDGQYEAVTSIEQAEKDVVIVQGPTGVGKTTIILSVLKRSGSRGFVLTPSMTLQDQYVREGKGVRRISGRRNYDCVLEDLDEKEAFERGAIHITSDEAPCSSGYECVYKDQCPYFLDRLGALRSRVSIHNYAYWLAESTYVGGFAGGYWVAADEGHVLDNVLSSFASVEVTKEMVNELKYWGIKVPMNSTDPWDWKEMGKKGVVKCVAAAEKCDDGTVEKSRWLLKLFNYEKLRDLEFGEDRWIVDIRGGRTVIKPVWAPAARPLLMTGKGKKLLVVSATVLNPRLFVKYNLRMKEEDVTYIELPWQFTKETRPIYYRPIASVTRKNAERASRAIAAATDSIMDGRKGERGIIHTQSFGLLDMVVPFIRNIQRLVVHRKDDDRREVINAFKKGGDDNKWLISPSVQQGEDFPYGLATSQIIWKMPYPDRGDKSVEMRMGEDKEWYNYATAQRLTQMLGRVVRANDDYGESWILDSQFENIVRYLPKEIRDALV